MIFHGTVKVKVTKGMTVKLKNKGFDGKRFNSYKFIVSSDTFYLCGNEVVSLNNIDGTIFRPIYPLSMLEVTDTATV